MYKINPKNKFVLFKQNNTFCAAPWSLIYIYPNGQVTTCVKGKKILGDLNKNSIEEILYNNQRNEIKQDMLRATASENCTRCLSFENSGNNQDGYRYLRNNYNELLKDLDIDYHNVNEFVLGALDLHWSSVCDLKCVTCWAKQSSSIAKEQGLPVLHLSSERANLFIDWVDAHQDTLKEIYLSGGEPTLIKYNLRLLEKIKKRSNLQIRVNSNLMWDQNNPIVAEILKFPNVLFTCSADSVEKKFEYIRRDSNWQKFLENLNFLQSYNHIKIRINSVFSVLTAADFVYNIEFFKNNLGITDVTVNQCEMGHTYLRARNLPAQTKIQCRLALEQAIVNYYSDLSLVGQLKNCLKELDQSGDESYVDFLENIDQLAGTNWQLTFKELT
jgi:radical SAM protein with 4Fe4S-binding SPASM domain